MILAVTVSVTMTILIDLYFNLRAFITVFMQHKHMTKIFINNNLDFKKVFLILQHKFYTMKITSLFLVLD